MSRRSREALLLDLGRGRASTVLVEGLLGLCSVLLGVALESLGGVASVLRSEIPQLVSLLVGQVVALLQLGINDLLVLDVDEGTEVSNDSGDQGQAPQRDKLDQEVGEEGGEEGLLGRIRRISSKRHGRQLTAMVA